MENPTIVHLDLTGCKGLEIHDRIKEAFDFPDYYGKNWSAFWDLLNEPRYYTVVEIRGLYTLPEILKPDIEKILEILQRNKEDYEEYMKKIAVHDCRFDYVVID